MEPHQYNDVNVLREIKKYRLKGTADYTEIPLTIDNKEISFTDIILFDCVKMTIAEYFEKLEIDRDLYKEYFNPWSFYSEIESIDLKYEILPIEISISILKPKINVSAKEIKDYLLQSFKKQKVNFHYLQNESKENNYYLFSYFSCREILESGNLFHIYYFVEIENFLVMGNLQCENHSSDLLENVLLKIMYSTQEV